MPETKDLLQQFEELSSDRRETLATQIFEVLAFLVNPLFFRQRSVDFPSIVSTPEVCGGSPRLIRTRIPVWVLQRMRQLGFLESKILESYPTLTASDLVQAWGYVTQHRSAIDKEIEENEQE